MQDYFSTFDIARICHVTPKTVANWVDAGKLKSFTTPGGYRKVSRSELEKFLRAKGMASEMLLPPGQCRVLISGKIGSRLSSVKSILEDLINKDIDFICQEAMEDSLLLAGLLKPNLWLMMDDIGELRFTRIKSLIKKHKDMKSINLVILTKDHLNGSASSIKVRPVISLKDGKDQIKKKFSDIISRYCGRSY